MKFNGFSEQDFHSMAVPGLEPRMDAIITNVRPKLEALGSTIAPYLSALCGEEMFPHVAKHARRTVHPPEDTWVAWASSKRGYKALPHFQVGLFASHLFIIFAVIYESPNKRIFGSYLQQHAEEIKQIVPDHYYWSLDHMKPGGASNQETEVQDLLKMAEKLQTVKKSEILCGLSLPMDTAVLRDGDKLTSLIEETFKQLLPLYKAAYPNS
ncbi:DUF1054 domain-containing protein [Paenibacillus sp. CAA11]|uniref:YktB family protein n=1 Tax=Paenibacillus sp. CAA11 TaxID=1532905 RepID=UPI000D3BB653|nr:DUF1054 domain-containing protein [Paenibacillus sp. CAA11]AWB45204.1 DUF1054 domain-containing protein [Paenibacillus sp. CAA11]